MPPFPLLVIVSNTYKADKWQFYFLVAISVSEGVGHLLARKGGGGIGIGLVSHVTRSRDRGHISFQTPSHTFSLPPAAADFSHGGSRKLSGLKREQAGTGIISA